MDNKNNLSRNCPKCGSIVANGYCENCGYCVSKVKMINQIELSNEYSINKTIDIVLTVHDNKGSSIIPLNGYITKISCDYETERPDNISFIFEGRAEMIIN